MGLGVKKGDMVVVIAGRERGKRGRIISVMPTKQRLIVERVNMIKKHMRPNKQYQKGGIIEKEAPLQTSNVMLVCTKCDKPTRVGNKVFEDGRKLRECKKCGEVIDQ